MTASREALPLAALESAVGRDFVSVDPQERALHSQDVFFWEEAPLVDVVVRPGTAEEVAAVLAVARGAGLAVAPRGGGVSYTKGYVPHRAGTILIDLSRFNAVHTLAPDDLYMTVGAACTWQQVATTAAPHGLRSVMRGPISGSFATVGGSAAQNTSGGMSGILGLEAVLGDGRIVHTGSGARGAASVPFYRDYGPDLTGLLCGDTGAFAIKTKVTLALEPIPQGVAFASVALDSLEALADVMTAVSRRGLHASMIGMDPLKNRTATKVDAKEGLQTLGKVVTGAGSLLKGLKQAVNIAAAGRASLDDVPWSLHVTVEGHDQRAAESALDSLRPLWREVGRELTPAVPTALRARPYSIRGIVGINGERWVPIHGVFPLSRAREVASAIQALFASRRAEMSAHGIEHSYLSVSSGAYWVLEPMFYWFDQLGPLHARVLGEKFARFKDIPANPAARAFVRTLRKEVAALFARHGAVHAQLGKFYDVAAAMEAPTYALLTDLKRTLDPDRLLNPGNLAFS